MATLKQLGLEVEDYVAYLRGSELDDEKVKLIEEHWNDRDFPNKASDYEED